jgi:hypothetical protein
MQSDDKFGRELLLFALAGSLYMVVLFIITVYENEKYIIPSLMWLFISLFIGLDFMRDWELLRKVMFPWNWWK